MVRTALGVAVIGCGWAGEYVHLRQLQTAGAAARLVWVIDADATRAAAAARQFGAVQGGTSLEPALADPDVDAVIIATPTALHAPQAVAAARAGKHVLVEKPMADSTTAARAMETAAAAAGVVLMVGHCCRFLPAFIEARRLIAAGRIGQVLQIQARRNIRLPAADMKPWWHHERPNGFLLSWLGSHIIDLTLWLLGQRPVRVAAEFGRSRPGFTGDDAFAVLMAFEHGVIVTIEQSMNASDPEHDYVIIGSEGTLRVRDYVALSVDGTPITLTGAPVPAGLPGSHVCYPLQQREFLAAIREQRRPAIDAREGIRTMEVIDACYEAGRTQSVRVLAAL